LLFLVQDLRGQVKKKEVLADGKARPLTGNR
jgi:hypothetical protein